MADKSNQNYQLLGGTLVVISLVLLYLWFNSGKDAPRVQYVYRDAPVPQRDPDQWQRREVKPSHDRDTETCSLFDVESRGNVKNKDPYVRKVAEGTYKSRWLTNADLKDDEWSADVLTPMKEGDVREYQTLGSSILTKTDYGVNYGSSNGLVNL